MVPAADPKVAFKDVDVALLVGARPRGPGMERKDLLEANGKIFAPQGKALDEVASRDVKVLVVGNPANTNCLIAMKNAPSLKPAQFTAMMRLDHNRALTQVAQKIGKAGLDVTQDDRLGQPLRHAVSRTCSSAEVDGKKAWPMINDQAWLEKARSSRRCRSAAPRSSRRAACRRRRARRTRRSTTCATGSHGTRDGDWVTMGIPSDGSYGIAEGVIYGYPVTCKGGKYQIVKGLEVSDFSRARMHATLKELHEERDGVKHLLG